MDRILLAYDGSAKAQEALFAATYLAGSWNAPLDVVTATEGDAAATMAKAGQYAEKCGVHAMPVGGQGPAAEAILRAAQEQGSNLLIMGGYGRGPLLHVVLGSAVDGVLRKTRVPVLICQ
jgi:nucleotide-binding universal stress UspA family protein